MNHATFGFIGLGLIGGSIARAIRKHYPDAVIFAYDISQDALDAATRDKVVDVALPEIGPAFRDCNYLFLCAPVQKNDENLRLVQKYLSPDCILTDVGSVKCEIHEVVREAGLDHCFVGGHPMAGSERVGYVNSKAVLLENAYYILTPTETVAPEKTERMRELVQSLGAIPLILDCEQHDYVTAAVSHLPHVIAASLVNLVRDSDSPDGLMKMIAAGGFKDITRIASSSAVMWQQICLTNRENIQSLLCAYIHSLETIRDEISAGDGDKLYTLFDSARSYRESFINASSGPIKRSYALNIDINDEPGAIATIATILALQQINIKNIGIVHNREYEGGILRLELYDEDSVIRAKEILESKSYNVHSIK